MQLNSNDLFLLTQCAISAAMQAGQIIANSKADQIAVQTKAGGESLAAQVVTEVDHLCQGRILKTLLPSCAIYDLALLTEESPDTLQRLHKDYFWCVDPLDGTLPFIEATPGYAVSIALVARDGQPFIGVIYDPVEHVLYHTIKGCGAFRNGKHWDVKNSTETKPDTLTFITDRSFAKHKKYPDVLTELKKIAESRGYAKINSLLHGGAAMNACWVLEHAPACYFKFPKPQQGGGSLWDYAATACLFVEAGASVSDMSGVALDLNRPDACFMNHHGILYASDHDLAQRVMRLFVALQDYTEAQE